MMLRVRFIELDKRLRAFCANAQTTYSWYLEATRGTEENLRIQRKIISNSKAYATLRSDLKRGCILPPIVTAVKSVSLNTRFCNVDSPLNDDEELSLLEEVADHIRRVNQSDIYIIDGLQRTNAIRQVADELTDDERTNFLASSLRLEVWLNIDFSALAYRMLLLNAGQRPMSIKHQVEILSQSLKIDLQSIRGIEIIDLGRRRVRPGQFQLSKLSLAFQAWLQGNPTVDVRNVIVEQMMADAALETLSASIGETQTLSQHDGFRAFVEWLVYVDDKLGDSHLEFFGTDTVMQGLAAAVGVAQRDANLSSRVHRCLDKIRKSLDTSSANDVLGVEAFNSVRKGIDPSKKNVGEATRSLTFYAFQEYFIADGIKSMPDCWQFAGARA